jgi:glycosyltransferase involved in cell wall biosynthesis
MQNYRVASSETTDRQPAKILFVSPLSCLYGGELCLLEAATGLDRQRFAPTVVSGGEGPLLAELRAAQVPVKVLRMPYMTQRGRQAIDFVRGVLPASLRLARYIRQGQFDLVYNNILQNPYGALAARLAGVPCLWHVHEVGKNPLLRKGITRVAGLLATRLVVVSQAVGAMFSSGAQQKIRLVYNGVAPQHFDPNVFDPAAARRTFSIQPSQPVVGIIGRLHPSKRHHDLLLAMSDLRQRWPDCLLLIVGDGPFEFEQDLRRTTRRLGLEENVRFFGYIADVRELLAALDVLVLPSDHEAFPRVPLEAMAMAKPVVATNVGGIPEAVSPDTGLLVSVGNPKELAAAISFILEDRERATEMGRRGRERVLAQFSLEHYVQGLEDVMTEMLSGKGSSIKSPSTLHQPKQVLERTPHQF